MNRLLTHANDIHVQGYLHQSSRCSSWFLFIFFLRDVTILPCLTLPFVSRSWRVCKICKKAEAGNKLEQQQVLEFCRTAVFKVEAICLSMQAEFSPTRPETVFIWRDEFCFLKTDPKSKLNKPDECMWVLIHDGWCWHAAGCREPVLTCSVLGETWVSQILIQQPLCGKHLNWSPSGKWQQESTMLFFFFLYVKPHFIICQLHIIPDSTSYTTILTLFLFSLVLYTTVAAV